MFIVESLGTIDSLAKKQTLKGSCAFAVNNLGWIVGVAEFSQYYKFRPFLWRPGMAFMHDLGLPPGESYAQPVAINDKGQVLIEGYLNPPNIYVWSINQGFTSIDDPAVYLSRDISEEGTIVASKEEEACIVRNGIVTKLGKLPGAVFSTGVSINKHDEVVGYSWFPDGKTEAFIWREQTGIKQVAFGAPMYEFSEFVRINDVGHVLAIIGSSGWTSASTYRIWKPDGTSSGTVKEIPPPPKPDCYVLGFNNADEIFASSMDGWFLFSQGKWELVLSFPLSFGGNLSGFSQAASSSFIGCFNDSQQVVGCVTGTGKLDQAVRAFPNPIGKIHLYHKPKEILPGWVYHTFPPVPKQQPPDLLASLKRILTPLAIAAAAERVMDSQLRRKIMRDAIESVLSVLQSNQEPEEIVGPALSHYRLLEGEMDSWPGTEWPTRSSEWESSVQQELRDAVTALELAHRARTISLTKVRRDVQQSSLRAVRDALEALVKTLKEKNRN